MAVDSVVVEGVRRRITTMWPHLSERQRRLLLGVEARELGWGGVSSVARVAGVARSTVTVAVAELEVPTRVPEGRSRRVGGGRKSSVEKDPGLVGALDALVDPGTRGDPESPLRWTCKSTRQLARTLTAAGHPVSDRTTASLLHQGGYSLQANAKTTEGAQHPHLIRSRIVRPRRCCTRVVTACRPTPRPLRAPSIPTVTASSRTSTTRWPATSRLVTR